MKIIEVSLMGLTPQKLWNWVCPYCGWKAQTDNPSPPVCTKCGVSTVENN